MRLFIRTLGVLACIVSTGHATALQFRVETGIGKASESYLTTGILLSEAGVCVIGLPNTVSIKSVSIVGEG